MITICASFAEWEQTALSTCVDTCGALQYSTLWTVAWNVLNWSEIISPSAPCVPTDVVVRRNCGQSFAQVTWQASRGALSYQASARDKDGQRLLCSSNETSCRLEGLMCSEVYSVGVIAMGDNCNSNQSSAEILQIGKNEQESISVEVFCNYEVSKSFQSPNNNIRLLRVLPLQHPALPLSSMPQWTVPITLPC